MNIGAKLKLLRKQKNITQEALAEYLYVSPQAVSKWETGAASPDIDTLPKLAVFFGTSVDNLLDFDQSRVDAAVAQLVEECGKSSGGDPAKAEAFLKKALEKYPNNDLLLTCLLEVLQDQNKDRSRSAEIISTGERVLACTKDDEMKIDVLRIIAQTYHSVGEQAMAEHYLSKIPALNFLYYEVAAGIKSGNERLGNIEMTEELCIDKLISALALRMEEAADENGKAAIDQQAREMLGFFRKYPAYGKIAEIMERHWNDGSIKEWYQY